MAADFLVTVGADMTAYLKAMGTADDVAKKTSADIVKSLKAAANASKEMGGVVAKGSNQAAFALTNLGRVAQDAPFGFIGIQNNLNPLLESFQRLKAETGSTGTALKALTGALMGPAGLGIALAVVSSAITFYTMWQQKNKKATKETDDTTKSYVDTLDSVRQATLKGQQDGEAEIVRLRILYNATQNHQLSIEQRNLAYDELAKKYPKWFANSEREKTLLGENRIGYENLAISILAAANAKAYESKIGENSNRVFEDTLKINDATAKLLRLRKELLVAQKAAQATGGTDIGGGGDLGASLEVIRINKEIAAQIKARSDLYGDQTKLYNENMQLAAMASELELAAGFKTGQELDDKNTKLKEQKTALELLEKQLKSLEDAEVKWLQAGNKTDPWNLTDLEKRILRLTGTIEGLKTNISSVGLSAPDAKGTDLASANLLRTPTLANPQSADTVKQLMNWQKASNAQAMLKKDAASATAELTKQAKTVNSLANAFGGGLTQAFQTALSGTQSFVSAMASFLGDLITRLIAAAAAAAVLAVILSAVGLGGGLAGAASAAGSFKNLFGAFSGVKLAEGGITTGPTRALIGEGREKEAVMPLSKLQQFVNGNNGNGDWQIAGVLRGPNQLLQIRRAEQQKARIG